MKRNDYLVNNYLKTYMVASVLTMAVLQINGAVDSIMMGHFLGPDALAAVSVSAPALSVIGAIASLLAGGAVILAGKALGARENGKANHIAVTVLISTVVAGIILAVISFFTVDYVANWLCIGNSLYPLVKSYLGIIMLGSVVSIMTHSLDQLTDVGGNPKIVTQTSVANCITNLVMNFILVGCLGFDIRGAAISTIVAGCVSIIWLLHFMLSEKSPYKLSLEGLQFGAVLGENIKNGIPLMFSSLSSTALIVILNYFIQKMQGEVGMFVMSIILITMGFGLLLAGGSSTAFSAIGSMMVGRGDYVGLRMLYKRCVAMAVSTSVIAVILTHFAAGHIARLFGAEDPVYIDMAVHALPVASWFILAFCLLVMLAVVYQVMGNLSLCTPAIAALPVFTAIGFGIVYYMEYYDYLWYVFPFAGFGALLTILIISEFVRRKSDIELSPICLLPTVKNDDHRMNISVRCSHEGLVDNINSIRNFGEKLKINDRIMDHIVICLEELSINIVEHSGRGEKSYIDVGLVIEGDDVKAYIQDNGKAFDPTKFDTDKQNIGLNLVHKYCKDVTYQYSFGQNATFMKWKIENGNI